MLKLPRPLLLLALLSFAIYASPWLVSTKLIVIDEVGIDFFSSQLSQEGRLAFWPPGDELFDRRGFVSGHSVYRASGESVPKQPPGFILLAALAKWLTPGKLYLLLNPMLGACCVLLLVAIARRYLPGEQLPLYAAILLATTPVFVHWSQLFFLDNAHLCVFLLAFLFMLKSFESRHLISVAAFGMSLAAMIWMRQTSAVLLLPFALVWLMNWRRTNLRMWYAATGAFALPMALLLIFNDLVYGSPLEIGYTLETFAKMEDRSANRVAVAATLLTAETGSYATRALSLGPALLLAFPALPLAIAGLVGARAEPSMKQLSLFLLLTLLVLFALFGNRLSYGTDRADLTLQSSMLRYLLPFIALLPLPAIWLLAQSALKSCRWVAAVVAVNLCIAAFAHFGMIHTVLNRLYMDEVDQFVGDATPQDTVAISRYWEFIVSSRRLAYSGHVSSSKTLQELIQAVHAQGYSVAMIFHETDKAMFDGLGDGPPFQVIRGPDELHPLLRMLPVPIPSAVYPVQLYLFPPPHAPLESRP
ncbi:MAG: glycosyltransferase family 39 protein [Pseudomonadota bacterium]